MPTSPALPRRATALVGAALSLAAIALPARAATLPPAISVTGEATVSAAPDMANVDGGVTTEARTARDAVEANNKAMAAVLQALKAAGIADKDLQSSRIALQPQSAPSRSDGPVQIVGYRATNHVTVTLHDVGKVATTIDTMVGAGANELGGIGFAVTQASWLLDEARTKAIADARRKAEIYAKAANVTLGAPLSISEGNAEGPMPVFARKMSVAMAPTPIAPGEETLRVVVNVSYAIKSP
jgi:uncharacterized protein YggE